MGFFSRLFGREIKNITSEDILRQLYGGVPSSSGIAVSPNTAMQCATVFACVRVLAESVAQLPLPLYIRNADGGKKKATNHHLMDLLNSQPNEWQTAFEFREMLMGHLCLRGKAFAFQNRLDSGKLMELIPLHPDRVEVKQNKDYTLNFKYTPGDGSPAVALKQSQVFYVRGISSDGINALSPIGLMREAVGLSLATEKHGATLFKNGARFRGFLKHPTHLTPEAAKNLKESFDTAHSGENAYRTPLLEEGLDYASVSMNSQDAQFLETRKFQVSEIARVFRVPPHMVGDLERATFSNIEQQSIEFVVYSLMPWLRRFEQAIWRDLILPTEQSYLFAEFLIDGFLRGDTKSRYEAHNLAIQGGWKNRNEARIQENMNPAEGLDEFLTPLNMTLGNPPPSPTVPPEKTNVAK